MAQFDPIRAQYELIAGIEEALSAIRVMSRQARCNLHEAEAAFNALVKIEALARERLDDERAKLTRLELELETDRTE
jgi:hypothetical protein